MQRTISWTNPNTYTDGTPIAPLDLEKIVIHIFKDDVEVYNTLPGIYTSFPIEVNRGETNGWQLQSELNTMKSPLSPVYSYTEPFQTPMVPIIRSIL